MKLKRATVTYNHKEKTFTSKTKLALFLAFLELKGVAYISRAYYKPI